jgi:cysteine desulfurase
MVELLTEGIPEIKINSPVNPLFSPYILNVSIPWTRGEIMVHSLEDKDIYVSTTSACSSKGKSKSHVLEAIGLDDKCIEGTLRISFSHENTEDDIRIAAREITNAAVEIRSIMRR